MSESDLEKSKLMAKERAKTQAVNPLAISSSSPVTSTIVKPSITSLLSSIQSEKKIASEYYTNEEMSQFKKKRKRVRKVRQIVFLLIWMNYSLGKRRGWNSSSVRRNRG